MTGPRVRDESFELGGVEYWFELAEKGGQGFSSADPWPAKSSTGSRVYADYDPLSAVAFVDLSGGMGQEKATDPTRYFDAENVDARGGRLILGPASHLIPVTPAGLESHATDLLSDTFTYDALDWKSVDSSGAPKVAGSFVAYTGMTSLERIWLPIRATVAATTITIGLYNDGGGGTGPGTQITTTTLSRDALRYHGAWVEAILSAPVTLIAGSLYWVSVEHSGPADSLAWAGGYVHPNSAANAFTYNGAAWVADSDWYMLLWIEDPLLTPDGPLHYLLGAGEDAIVRLWAFSGRRLYYFAADSTPTGAEDGGGNIYKTTADICAATWFRAVSDSHAYLYLALGDATDLLKFDANIGAEQWAVVTDIQARALAVHDNMLWRADERNQISGSLDGAAFGSAIGAGDRTYPVVKMLSWNGALYIGKADGLYKVTYPDGYPTTGTPAATKIIDFAAQADHNNFSLMLEHQGDLVFSIGQGILKYTGSAVLTPISPDTGLDLAAGARSLYRAGFSSLNALWVVAEAPPGEHSSLLTYVDYHWHPLITVPRTGDIIRSVWVEPGLYGAAPRVWFGAGLQAAYALMPTTTQRRWLWSDMDYAYNGTIDLPWVDGNLRTIDKDWVQVELDVDSVSLPLAYVVVYWRPDEDTEWEQLGAPIQTTGISICAFPAASFGAKAQLRILLSRGPFGTSAATPHVHAVVLKYLERPSPYQIFTRSYLLQSDATTRAGLPVPLSLEQQIQQLETLRASKEPLTWLPWWSNATTYQVHIVQYNASEQRTLTRPGSDAGSVVVSLRLLVVG